MMERQLNDAWALHELGVAAYQAGKPAEAVQLIEQAIALNANVASFYANLALMQKGIVDDEERLLNYHHAIALEPANPAFRANLAATLNALARFPEAEVMARAALGLAPERAESWHNLGSALAGQQLWADASKAYDRAVKLGLRTVATCLAAARMSLKAKFFASAIEHFQVVLALSGADHHHRVECWHGLGQAFEADGQAQEALRALHAGLALDTGNGALLIDLGNLYKRLRQVDAARQCYEDVLNYHPECIEAMFNLAALEQDIGQYDKALHGYRQVLAHTPDLSAGWHNLAACLTYSARAKAEDVRTALVEFDARVAAPLISCPQWTQSRDPERRLRVAYVSADFRAHPVGFLALPLIEGHDRNKVHVTCYFSHQKHDVLTESFKRAADAWCEVGMLSDQALAERVHADGIDILVDLAGHSEGNRLLAFARRPAPVQVTWMGYVTTTGMQAMDWRITHADADPQGAQSAYTEKLWRLPGAMWCFRPLPKMPDITPTPCIAAGFVTFGALNRFSKNSPEALAAWAEILLRVPGSRLLVCASPGEATAKITLHMEQAGVAIHRIQTFAHMDHAGFWALHATIDIALDPFPFNGGMTSCESLWMGVPLVSCAGANDEKAGHSFPARFASRMGYALLNGIGLGELASTTIPDYINSAVALANDPARLATLRRTLRSRMSAAPLMDERRFVNEMEDGYRAMWREFCIVDEPLN